MTEVTEQVRLLPATVGGVGTVAKFFRALGDPSRLRLLEYLLDGEHSVSDCVAHIGLSQGRISTHLACLADCGYVQSRREGRWCYYQVTDPRVAELVMLARALAADNCAALAACERIDGTSTAQVQTSARDA
ncbi:MAG: ArsR/SmtB family transcription factor [Pseudonocardiaceae bacterium]